MNLFLCYTIIKEGEESEMSPIELHGIWTEGFALDRHVVSSTFIGEDAFGHPQYDTQRTPIGEALYQFKYRNVYNALSTILELAYPFLDTWEALKNIDVILPVPPSKKERFYQPVQEIAKSIAEYIKKPYSEEVLAKTTDEQAKNQNSDEKQSIAGSIIQLRPAKSPCKILLIDDLFQSGATLTECTQVLMKDKLIKAVFVLTITKTAKELDPV
jgi:predicted amidophosphoribosyltransferase